MSDSDQLSGNSQGIIIMTPPALRHPSHILPHSYHFVTLMCQNQLIADIVAKFSQPHYVS